MSLRALFAFNGATLAPAQTAGAVQVSNLPVSGYQALQREDCRVALLRRAPRNDTNE